MIAITVADGGICVEVALEVARAEGRLGHRYRLHGDGVALHGVVASRHAALEAAFTRLLDGLRMRGVGLLPVATVGAGGRSFRLRLRGGEAGGYACAVWELTEHGVPVWPVGEAEAVGSPRLALILGYELALAVAGALESEADA